jgi:DNA-binding HxlR family transcriptional regulator
MLGRDYERQNCSVARALEVVGERWTLLILRDAFLGVTRFDRFLDRLGLAPNILTKRLRTLIDAGIMERRLYQERPERHEYVLTDKGKDLFPVLMGLMNWGDTHLAPHGAPAVARHAGCGGEVDGRARCLQCGETVRADDAEWHRGPGFGRRPMAPSGPA